MKKTYYFQHDFNAREDPKLMAVQERFGLEGLGFFWCIVEYLYEQGGKLRLSAIDAFAYRMHFDKDKANAVINDFELFGKDEEFFWSPSILRRIEKMNDVADKRRQAARNRWNKDVNPESAKEEKTRFDYQSIIKLYHDNCPSLPGVQKLTESRRNKIKSRMKEIGSVEKLVTVFQRIENSEFCKGSTGWRADFDWIFANDSNWQKVLSGRYDNKKGGRKNSDINANDEWK